MPLTSWLDGITKDPVASEVWGGELLARLLEIPIDLFTGILGEKLVKFFFGLGLTWVARKRGGALSREGREIVEIASHMALDILDPKPEDIQKLKDEVTNLKRAIGLGSTSDILKTLFRSPDEVFGVLGAKPTPKPAPPKRAPAPTPAKTYAYAIPLEGREG